MISALHLIWIVPLSVWFGLFVTALMVAAKDGDKGKHEEDV